MNRTELVDSVAQKAVLDKKRAEAAVNAMTDTVIAETKAGNKVTIFGFGTFSPGSRAARMGRNPQTGAPVKIAASKVVRFSPAVEGIPSLAELPQGVREALFGGLDYAMFARRL